MVITIHYYIITDALVLAQAGTVTDEPFYNKGFDDFKAGRSEGWL